MGQFEAAAVQCWAVMEKRRGKIIPSVHDNLKSLRWQGSVLKLWTKRRTTGGNHMTIFLSFKSPSCPGGSQCVNIAVNRRDCGRFPQIVTDANSHARDITIQNDHWPVDHLFRPIQSPPGLSSVILALPVIAIQESSLEYNSDSYE